MRQKSAVTLLQNKPLDVTTDISLPHRHAGVHKRSKHLEAASKFRAPEGWHETDGPQILGATAPNVVAMAILCPGLVQLWVIKLGTFRIQFYDARVH